MLSLTYKGQNAFKFKEIQMRLFLIYKSILVLDLAMLLFINLLE
jgi:hypothetical protein